MADGNLVLGVDLGGTDIKSAVLTSAGVIRWSGHTATCAAQGREVVLDRLAAVVAEAARAVAPTRLCAVGFAIPGVLDLSSGRIELLTNFTRDWTGFPLRDALAQRTHTPTFLLNDVRAATVAEHTWGAGRPYRDFLCIAIGTGIGGGLVLGGQIYMGSRGAAGELGHQTIIPDGPRCHCGNAGCLEALASGYALTRDAHTAIAAGDSELARLAGSDEPTPRQIARAAEQGSAGARAIYQRAGTYVGWALGNLVCVLNPAAIVVGGGVAAAGDLLLDPIRAEIERRTTVFTPERGGVAVLPSPLGGQAGAMGAAAWAMLQLRGTTTEVDRTT